MTEIMKEIDESQLESDIQYRYQYLVEFIGFTTEDAAAIGRLHLHLQPHIPELVQATYDKLLSYSATARHFLQPQHGCPGPPPTSLAALSTNHEQIKFRKEHLKRYLMILLANPYDAQMVKYLDMVGKIHTPAAGNKNIHVPLIQMNALMGLLSHLILGAIQQLGLTPDEQRRAITAFNKLLWIQNDFIQRHYVGHSAPTPTNSTPTAPASEARSGWR